MIGEDEGRYDGRVMLVRNYCVTDCSLGVGEPHPAWYVVLSLGVLPSVESSWGKHYYVC